MSPSPARLLVLRALKEPAWREQVLSWAAERAWDSYFTWNSINSPAGFPDLVLLKPPQLVFAELKTVDGRVTPRQRWWINRLNQVPGVRAYIWRPTDEDLVLEVLGAIDPRAVVSVARRGRAWDNRSMPNLNAKESAARDRRSGDAADIKSQGVYQDVAGWRRQQTLTKAQLDPTRNSAPRRRLYKTGK